MRNCRTVIIPGVELPAPGGRTLFILRHGATGRPGGEKRFIGQTDLALSRLGFRQARAWAEIFSGIPLAGMLCSDLKRSRDTAAIIGKRCGIDPVAASGLREIDLGAWEGLSFREVRETDPEAFARRGRDPAGYRPGQGESFRDLQRRVVAGLEGEIRRMSGPILLVGHAGVNRVLLCHLLGLPLKYLFRLAQDPAGLSVVALRRGGCRLVALNTIL